MTNTQCTVMKRIQEIEPINIKANLSDMTPQRAA